MTVTMLVPYRPDGAERDQAWEFAERWWADRHPDWQIITVDCPDPDVWSKGAAVRAGLPQADGQVVVVADADVLCEQVEPAVQAVVSGRSGWAVPHRIVLRLSPTATRAVHAGGPLPDPNVSRRQLGPQVVERHVGMVGGGIVVLPRSTLAEVSPDPRFVGWGQEDAAWGHALTVLAGAPWLGHAALWHLWHPPAPRRSRRVGSEDGRALWRRYRRALTPDEVRGLLAEVCPGPVNGPGHTC